MAKNSVYRGKRKSSYSNGGGSSKASPKNTTFGWNTNKQDFGMNNRKPASEKSIQDRSGKSKK